MKIRTIRGSGVLGLALLGVMGVASSLAQAQLRIACWNISNYSGGRNADIQTSVYGINAANGMSMRPDAILLQEIMTPAALAEMVTTLNGAPGSPGTWAAAPWTGGPDRPNAFVYRTDKLTLVDTKIIALGSSDTSEQPRHTSRYDIRPVGYSAAGATIGCYNTHLKAQESGTSDDNRRLLEAQRIRDNAQGINTNGAGTALPAGYQFLVAGDFNIQSSSDISYVELVGSQANNAGRSFDPINLPGTWNNSGTFAVVHTQDPTGSGGMDDRFDFILLSAGLLDQQGMDYVGVLNGPQNPVAWNLSTAMDANHSYRCWGNDGATFNAQIRTTGNTMVGATISQALKNAATAAGGHLPVFLDLRVPPKVSSSTVTINFGTVTQNAVASQSLGVFNNGNTTLWNAAGIASLSYTLSASAGFTAPGGSFSDGAGGGSNSHTITMNTSTLGPKAGTVTIASNDPDVPSLVVNLTGTVVPANTPPVANAGTDQTVTDSDLSGSEIVTLNGSGSTDDGTITNYTWKVGTTTLASGASPSANVSFGVGVHVVELTVTDNGSLTGTDTVTITVNPGNQPPVANAGTDQTVTDSDGSGAEVVTLNGSGSTDDGTITTYTWKEGPTTLASGPSPTANVSLGVGVHTIVLTVTDNGLLTANDTVVVTVNPRPCIADVDDGTGTGNPDGGVGIEDLLYYLGLFEAGSVAADVDDGNGTGTPDGGVGIEDLLYYLSRFEGGC